MLDFGNASFETIQDVRGDLWFAFGDFLVGEFLDGFEHRHAMCFTDSTKALITSDDDNIPAFGSRKILQSLNGESIREFMALVLFLLKRQLEFKILLKDEFGVHTAAIDDRRFGLFEEILKLLHEFIGHGFWEQPLRAGSNLRHVRIG